MKCKRTLGAVAFDWCNGLILTLFALDVDFKVARQRGVDKTIARIRKELGDET